MKEVEVDALEPRSGAWLRAVVLARKGRAAYVHYVTWPASCDAWRTEAEVALRGTHVAWPGDASVMPRPDLWCDVRTTRDAPWACGIVRAVCPGGTYLRVSVVEPFESGVVHSNWLVPMAQLAASEASREVVACAPPRERRFWATRVRESAFAGPADARVAHYLRTLAERALALAPMGGDGNCLFRSFADQVYGDQGHHGACRGGAADYMAAEAAWFRSFVADEEGGWDAYLSAMRLPGTWGDDPEIQALCELYNRPCEIWAYDAALGARRLRVFNSADAGGAPDARPPVRLSYYGGGHYDSLRGPGWAENLLRARPGEVERAGVDAAGARGGGGNGGAAAGDGDGGLARALALSRAQFDADEAGNIELALLASMQDFY